MTPVGLFSLLVAMAVPGAPAASAEAVVQVTGAGDCPRATEVAAQLQPLLAVALAPPAAADVARVDVDGDRMTIVLRRPDGAVLGERTLPAAATCDERARAAAVVLATWESDVHPVFERPAPPEVVTSPPLVIAAPIPALASPLAVPALEATPPPSNVMPTPRVAWDLGAGVGAGASGSDWAAAARVVAAVLDNRRHRGLRASLFLEQDRSTPTGPGQARWSRWSLALGPEVRGTVAGWAVDMHLSLEAALFQTHGQGFPVSYQDRGVDPGLGAGLRLVAPGAGWRPWLAVDGTMWLRPRVVREAVQGAAHDLPAWRAAAVLGFSFFGPWPFDG